MRMTVKPNTSKVKLKQNFDIDFSELKLCDISKNLHPYIEYRIKILTISNISLKPGVEKIIPTNLINSHKSIPKHFNLQLKSTNKLPLKFLSEKFEIINNRLFVKLQNQNKFNYIICSKTPIAYLFIQPSI